MEEEREEVERWRKKKDNCAPREPTQDNVHNDLEGSFFSKIATLRHKIMQQTKKTLLHKSDDLLKIVDRCKIELDYYRVNRIKFLHFEC